MANKIIMRDSPEAAKPITLTGWVSSRGLFYREEATARYDGCTHVPCRDCGAPAEKTWLICQGCRDVADRKKFDALPRAKWDGVAMVYSNARDVYFSSPSDAEDSLEEGQTLDDLMLVICTPNHVRPLEGDYCSDELPDEGDDDVPAVVIDAMEAFNKAVAGVVLSWSPGKVALQLDNEEEATHG